MEAGDIVGVITPVISLIFAGVFAFIWKGNRERSHALSLGIAYAMVAVAFSTAWLLGDIAPKTGLFLCGVIGLGATIPFVRGLLYRFKITIPYEPLIMLLVFAGAMTGVALGAMENLNAAMMIASTVGGLKMGVIAYSLRDAEQENSSYKTVVGVLLSVGCLLMAHPALSYLFNAAPLAAATYQNSLAWIALHMIIIGLCITTALSLATLIVQDAMQDLQTAADTDELTGLARRSSFERAATRVIAQTGRIPVPASMVICDLDHFKSINDRFGHLAGDQVLREFGKLIGQSGRETDAVGRLGGEEFGILLWNADISAARLWAEQLRSSLELHEFGATLEGENCTASFGVTQLQTDDTYNSLFARADEALYKAKNSGRNKVMGGKSLQLVA